MSDTAWRRNLFAVTAASFTGFMGFTLVMPFLPLYFQELGVSRTGDIAVWTGLSLGVTPALTAFLAPFWGRLADRFGRKIMVERSILSFVVVMGATAFVTRPWHVFALRTVQGFFAGYGALTLSMAAETVPHGRVATAIGMVQTAQRLGPAIGPIIGGVLAPLVGLRRSFLVVALLYLVAFLLVLVMYDETPRRAEARAGSPTPVTFKSILTFENFVLLMGVIFALQFVDRSFGPVLPLYVAEIGTPMDRVPLVAGLLFSMAAGAGAIGHNVCHRLLRTLSLRAALAWSGLAGAAAVLVYALAGHVGWLVLATPVFGLAVGVATTAAFSAAAGLLPAGAHATGFGLLTCASLTGLALSPVVSGLVGAFSLRAVFILDAAALAAVAVAVRRLMTGSRAASH